MFAKVWDLNVIIQDSIAVSWVLNVMLCYRVYCKISALIDCITPSKFLAEIKGDVWAKLKISI